MLQRQYSYPVLFSDHHGHTTEVVKASSASEAMVKAGKPRSLFIEIKGQTTEIPVNADKEDYDLEMH